ncbi:hypothetical protein [Botrimarina mediterranea]|uniref:Uncharacterized protein n=1 Tax=Botrimarina mediterranea TaxID=2528022 RepID=A0A518KBP1_9BACT|nr:hypothetical protein [Botrimarina mediterranea]QDV75217.1 hypothetical protein Spa11_34310 [Botrimarina mediterranea]QDV79886.1 hypothetical protein K2D_35060 [Planctomycetes bacterium K2D]
MRSLLFIALYTTAVVAVPHGVLSAPGVYEDHDHAAHEGHRHDEEGPHGGVLFALGNEEYHAELVFDEERNQVTVVVLDSAAKGQIALQEPHMLINVRGGGAPRQHKLTPLYADGQNAGPTAMYAAVGKTLMNDLHSHNAVAKLALRIAGKPYSTTLHHDHSGHQH